MSLRAILGLHIDLADDSHARASEEAEHGKTVAEVKECDENLEDVLVGLAQRVFDQISV